MEKSKEKLKHGKRGITLIALVVTIVVLLILAGVSINLVLGPNGLIAKAQEAALKTEEAQEKEGLYMAIADSQIKNLTTANEKKQNLEDSIKAQFGNDKDFSVTDNGDGSFLVSMNDTQRIYYIDETGKIIGQSKMLKISTADELKAFRDDVNSGNTYEGWYVYLANDINVNGEWTSIGKYISPDSTDNMSFNGIFDGKNYTIDGIQIDSTDDAVGLFSYVDNAKIKNLTIGKDSTIIGNNYVGGIIGLAINNSTIGNCKNYAGIQANGKISGGIVGRVSYGYIYNCSNNAKINSSSELAGGISGLISKTDVLGCYNTGDIEGQLNIGGIIGSGDGSTVSSCYNTGSIQANNNAGGILGQMYNLGIVKNCYNVGNIKTVEEYNKLVGAIVGVFNDTQTINTYYLQNTINSGKDIDNNSTVFTTEGVKSLYQKLGSTYKEDKNNINNGYPILEWQ